MLSYSTAPDNISPRPPLVTLGLTTRARKVLWDECGYSQGRAMQDGAVPGAGSSAKQSASGATPRPEKSEYRISKFETNSKHQSPMFKTAVPVFRSFEFRYCFVLRISNFEFPSPLSTARRAGRPQPRSQQVVRARCRLRTVPQGDEVGRRQVTHPIGKCVSMMTAS
jgi:hypothetical protein